MFGTRRLVWLFLEECCPRPQLTSLTPNINVSLRSPENYPTCFHTFERSLMPSGHRMV